LVRDVLGHIGIGDFTVFYLGYTFVGTKVMNLLGMLRNWANWASFILRGGIVRAYFDFVVTNVTCGQLRLSDGPRTLFFEGKFTISRLRL
jgi:hypothetical protein